MRRFIRASVLLMGTFLAGSLSGTLQASARPARTGYDVIASFPLTATGFHYSAQPSTDVLVWGPSTLVSDYNGGFWIGTAVSKEAFHINPKEGLIERVGFGDQITGLDDLAISPSGIWTLDTASIPEQVHLFNFDGVLKASVPLSPENSRETGTTGIDFDETSQSLYLAGPFGHMVPIADSVGQEVPIDARLQRRYNGLSLSVTQGIGKQGRSAGQTADIATPFGSINVAVNHALVGVEILDASVANGLYVLVSELNPDLAFVQVDETVRHYDLPSGKLLGQARVPLSERTVYTEHGVTVDHEGNVYALVTRVDRLDIVRLNFVDSLLPLSGVGQRVTPGGQAAPVDFSIQGCISRSTIVSNAAAYYNNYVTLNSTNINGACTLRTKPHYLSNPGPYTSVPYDWGGYDSIATFNTRMGQNYQAGDIETSGSIGEACSRGVDCSGFITNIWGMPDQHYGTGQLPSISTQITQAQLQQGDILLSIGVHTVMFKQVTVTQLVTVYESTTYSNLDRVFTASYNWSRFNGYGYYKYRNVCP